MANDTMQVEVKTRVAEGEAQSVTALSIIFDDAKAERDFAVRGIKIAAQAMMRASGNIPAELAVTVSELAKRERGGFAMKPSAANAQRMMGKLDDAQYGDALRAIGIAERDIVRLVANRVKSPAPVGIEAKRDAKRPGPVTVTKPAAKGANKK